MSEKTHTLQSRAGLPPALSYLIEQYPRNLWHSHENFDDLTRFWLSRHMEFRRALEMLKNDTQEIISGPDDPDYFQRRVLHIGRFFIESLHGHHHIEDEHYFPLLMRSEAGLEHGFEILDKDHHELDIYLNNMEKMLIGIAQSGNDDFEGCRVLNDELARFSKFLERHLIDEEELVVPIILKHGPVSP